MASTVSPSGSDRKPSAWYAATATVLPSWVFTATFRTRWRRSQVRPSATSAVPMPWRCRVGVDGQALQVAALVGPAPDGVADHLGADGHPVPARRRGVDRVAQPAGVELPERIEGPVVHVEHAGAVRSADRDAASRPCGPRGSCRGRASAGAGRSWTSKPAARNPSCSRLASALVTARRTPRRVSAASSSWIVATSGGRRSGRGVRSAMPSSPRHDATRSRSAPCRRRSPTATAEQGGGDQSAHAPIEDTARARPGAGGRRARRRGRAVAWRRGDPAGRRSGVPRARLGAGPPRASGAPRGRRAGHHRGGTGRRGRARRRGPGEPRVGRAGPQGRVPRCGRAVLRPRRRATSTATPTSARAPTRRRSSPPAPASPSPIAWPRAKGTSGLCAVRPPGHHATIARAMGFCLINHVAVTAAELAARGERVAIVDYDAHHGNGTQDIFYEHPDVLYVSMHEWPMYPGTGRLDEVGEGAGHGTTLNLPFPAGTTGDVYRRAVDDVIAPRIAELRADPSAHLGRLRRAPPRSAHRPRPRRRRLRRPHGRPRPAGARGPAAAVPRGWLRPHRPHGVRGGVAVRARRRRRLSTRVVHDGWAGSAGVPRRRAGAGRPLLTSPVGAVARPDRPLTGGSGVRRGR